MGWFFLVMALFFSLFMPSSSSNIECVSHFLTSYIDEYLTKHQRFEMLLFGVVLDS